MTTAAAATTAPDRVVLRSPGWTNFGEDFMTRYCTSCHSSELHGGHRRRAPPDHDYDTAGVQLDPAHLDLAAAGSGCHNSFMPPYGPLVASNSARGSLATRSER